MDVLVKRRFKQVKFCEFSLIRRKLGLLKYLRKEAPRLGVRNSKSRSSIDESVVLGDPLYDEEELKFPSLSPPSLHITNNTSIPPTPINNSNQHHNRSTSLSSAHKTTTTNTTASSFKVSRGGIKSRRMAKELDLAYPTRLPECRAQVYSFFLCVVMYLLVKINPFCFF